MTTNLEINFDEPENTGSPVWDDVPPEPTALAYTPDEPDTKAMRLHYGSMLTNLVSHFFNIASYSVTGMKMSDITSGALPAVTVSFTIYPETIEQVANVLNVLRDLEKGDK